MFLLTAEPCDIMEGAFLLGTQSVHLVKNIAMYLNKRKKNLVLCLELYLCSFPYYFENIMSVLQFELYFEIQPDRKCLFNGFSILKSAAPKRQTVVFPRFPRIGWKLAVCGASNEQRGSVYQSERVGRAWLQRFQGV